MTEQEAKVRTKSAFVSFVGAGPGDPELITVKGRRLLRTADVVIYAGSLVNNLLLDLCHDGVRLIDSASMDLKAITDVMVTASRAGKKVVRLQTGDPSIYSAVAEQAAVLEKSSIPYEMVPGVSSAMASAAVLKRGLTGPESTQTIILTRRGGRTPVPEAESLERLAVHGATLCIFLSVSMIEAVQSELAVSYPPKTPCAVVYRATWPDEQIIRTTLDDLAKEVRRAKITKHAMIIISRTLGEHELNSAKSKLYDSAFAHEYREVAKDKP